MSAEPFTLDTIILVYSVDQDAGHRHEIAKLILRRAMLLPCYLTLQAISEFYAAATRNGKMPTADAARVATDMMAVFQTVPASAAAIRAALATASAGRASYWDALLIATAGDAGCTTILTEDMADGSTLHGVQILNPFAGDRLASAAELLLSTG
jgi:predicted nucleic acid-binding protein